MTGGPIGNPLHDTEGGDEPTPVERMQAEVDTEQDGEPTEEVPAGTVEVPLGDEGDVVRVLPANKWRSSAMKSLQRGDFDTWAEKCLVGDDYEEVWAVLDPTMDEAADFFAAYGKASGQAVPQSRASRRSLRSTARR